MKKKRNTCFVCGCAYGKRSHRWSQRYCSKACFEALKQIEQTLKTDPTLLYGELTQAQSKKFMEFVLDKSILSANATVQPIRFPKVELDKTMTRFAKHFKNFYVRDRLMAEIVDTKLKTLSQQERDDAMYEWFAWVGKNFNPQKFVIGASQLAVKNNEFKVNVDIGRIQGTHFDLEIVDDIDLIVAKSRTDAKT